jgi:hypothetical protein
MNTKKTVLSAALTCLLFSGTATADTAIGAYVNHDGWTTRTIDELNDSTTRAAATINLFSSFDYNWWGHLRYQASNIVSRNATPLITWMPYKRDRPDANILQEISTGQFDGYIYSWIDGFKYWRSTYPADQQPKIALRFAHEFNGTWYPWGDKPEDLKTAWRYLHAKFVAAGIGDAVDWVWCANNVDVDSYDDITQYYPGDDVVDWLSLDGYNWGSNYSFSSWKSFDETFSQQYVKMISNYPSKPIMLGEVSSAEPHDLPNASWGQNGDDSDAGESKEEWVADMMQSIQSYYPAIKAIVWFNTNKELKWGLNLEGNTGLSAYNHAVSDPYFAGTMTAAPIETEASSMEEPSLQARADDSTTSEKLLQAKSGNNQSVKIEDSSSESNAYGLSKRPEVTGVAKLKKEAAGLRKMNRKLLKKWRLESILPADVDKRNQ